MEGVSGVAETEWYLEVFPEAKGSEDGDLGDVLGGYWHLVVILGHWTRSSLEKNIIQWRFAIGSEI